MPLVHRWASLSTRDAKAINSNQYRSIYLDAIRAVLVILVILGAVVAGSSYLVERGSGCWSVMRDLGRRDFGSWSIGRCFVMSLKEASNTGRVVSPFVLGLCFVSGNGGQWTVWVMIALGLDLIQRVRSWHRLE